MKKKNKKISNKGFSLIELLAVIIIVGILAVVSISAVTKYINQTRRQKVVQNKKNVAIAAELYLQANRDLMPKMVGEVVYIPIKDLRNTNYIKEDVTNDKGEDCMKESFVRVFKLAEGDYNYTTYLYCGDEKAPAEVEPPKPYLVDFIDGEETVKVLFSDKDDVKKANFSFKLRGSQEDNTIGLYSYSYSIFVKTGTSQKFTEIYNSGTIEANKNPAIEFKSRPISSYVDLPGVTAVQIKVTALNEQGGFLSYETDLGNAGGNTEYEDTIPPVCPDYDDTSARIGEPRTLDEWIGKDAVGSSSYPRVITLKCEDGDGSGCKRETFTESWPNENKNPLGKMFGEIVIEDNAVVDSAGNIKEPNKTSCPILVFVDLQSPSVEISPVNPAPKEGTPINVGLNIEYKGKTYTSTPVPVKDAQVPMKDNLEDITLTINDLNYVNNFHDYDEEEGWLNDEYYPEGIEYDVTIKDNIFLYKYTWEVNEPYLNTKSPFLKETSPENPESVIWNRVDDEELGLNEEELISSRKELTEEQNIKHFTVSFKEEGARYGVLTVYDRAGNTTTIYIYANLDRTHPPIDEHDYGVQRYMLDPSNIPYNPDEFYYGIKFDIPTETELTGTAGVEEETALGQNINDPLYQGYDVCEDDAFKGKDMEWQPGMVVNCAEGKTKYNRPGLVPKACKNTNHESYGTVYNYETEKVEREETGCYKVGTLKGDNGIEPKDYLDDSVFAELEEYKSGTWSNEEIICGPKTDMLKDNLYTKVNEEGKKETVELPDEISGWVAVQMLYYRQKSVQRSTFSYLPEEAAKEKAEVKNITKYDISKELERYSYYNNNDYEVSYDYVEPTYGEEVDGEYVKFYNINSLDRTTWPVIDDQGTHQLKWKNCDKAGNCSEYQLTENIKVDTVAPKCHNAVTYNDELNSDGTTGPNHNGWLYDKQTATVYHSCADSSNKDYKNYFEAIYSIRKNLGNLIYKYYDPDFTFNEFGSGCANDPDTKESFEYKNDVYTCEAGTGGVQNYGVVRDVAGNETVCKNGATVWKDTTPPICGTSVIYKGINSEKEDQYKYNVPNRYGWAMGGMTIDLMKTCNDSTDAKISEYLPPVEKTEDGNYIVYDEDENPIELNEEEYQQYLEQFKVYSACNRKDDANLAENPLYVSYVPSTYQGTAPIEEYTYGDVTYRLFRPNNNKRYFVNDVTDIYAKVGADWLKVDAEEYDAVILGEDGKPTTEKRWRYNYSMQGGYVMDQAGNISERSCKLATAAKDSVSPTCVNKTAAMNGEFHEGEAENGVPKIWVGSTGLDGNKEYVKVYKGCNDVEGNNPENVEKIDKVMSMCEPIDLSDPENYWFYGDIENPDTDRVTPGPRKGSEGVSFDGPQRTPIGEEVRDFAGNKGTGVCEVIDVNIDYNPPICRIAVVEHTEITKFGERDTEPYQGFTIESTGYSKIPINTTYHYTWTNLDVRAEANCVDDTDRVTGRDISSGCDNYNEGERDFVWYNQTNPETGEREHIKAPKSKMYKYNAADHQEFVELYATDAAGNVTTCNIDFALKQDKDAPIVKCHYTGDYVKDGDPKSKITVYIDELRDPVTRDVIYDADGGIVSDRDVAVGIHYTKNPDKPFHEARKNSWYYQGKVVRPKPYHTALGVFLSTGTSYYSPTYDLEEGVYEYSKKLTCSPRGNVGSNTYYAWISVMDKNGNQTVQLCENANPDEKPVSVPVCCARTKEKDKCDEGHWHSCIADCNGGTQQYYYNCTNKGYYNNGGSCYFTRWTDRFRPCNEQKCCDYPRQYESPCSSMYNQNPCSWGYKESYTYSPYNSLIHCSSTKTSLCQVDQARCRDLGVDNLDGETFGYITPQSDSCDLVLEGNARRGTDLIRVLPTDKEHCKFANASKASNYTSSRKLCDAYPNYGENSLRVLAGMQGYYDYYDDTFGKGCEFGVEWTSDKYDYTKRPILKTQTFVIAKCKNRFNRFATKDYTPEYIYCLESCNNALYENTVQTKCVAQIDPDKDPSVQPENDDVEKDRPKPGEDDDDEYYSDKD